MYTTRSTSSPTSFRSIAILELQTALAGALGHFLDPAVIDVPVAVEHDLQNVRLLEPLGDGLADQLGPLLLLLAGSGRGDLLLAVRCRCQHPVRDVVDRLHVDVRVRPEHRQARPLGRPRHPLADGPLPAPASALGAILNLDVTSHGDSLPCGLADLAEDGLLRVLDALALVGLRRAEAPDLRRGGAEQLLVDPAQGQNVLLEGGGDAVR